MKNPSQNYIVLLLFLLVAPSSSLFAQPPVDEFKEKFQINIERTEEEVIIDGKLDEKFWDEADIATDFWQKSPFVTQSADPVTEVRMTYDDKNLYVGAKCYQKEKPVIKSLKRDNFWDSDGFAVLLDPMNAKTNCYFFASSAGGVQMDAIRGQISDLNSDWSNKWYAEVDVQEDHYTVEIAIPFSILRYAEKNKEWGINFVRNATAVNEFHNWTAVPAQFWPVEPAYAGTLLWDEAPDNQSGAVNLIPYLTTGINDDKDDGTSADLDVGLDAK